MATINVTVYDSTENKRVPVELPDDAPCNKIIAVLIHARCRTRKPWRKRKCNMATSFVSSPKSRPGEPLLAHAHRSK